MSRSAEIGSSQEKQVKPRKDVKNIRYVEGLRRNLIDASRQTRTRDREYSHGELTRRMPPRLRETLERQVDALNQIHDIGEKFDDIEMSFYGRTSREESGEEQTSAETIIYEKEIGE